MSAPAALCGIPAAPPASGTRLAGRYRLDDLIGTAPGASEWKATDELLARPVTARVLHPGLAVAADVLAAVRAAARLTDPRLARVFDVGRCGERRYVISERAPGDHLDDLIAAGLPAPALACAIVADAAGALALAHAAGRPHLCLTPRSVLWDGAAVKITGLGIEAALAGTTVADPAAADTAALARMLYALLTGYWPGAEPGGLPPAPRRDGVVYSPRQVRAGVPGALDAVVWRALLPGPQHAGRPIRTPGSLARALRPPRRHASPPARPLLRVARAVPGTGRRPRPQHGRWPVPALADGWGGAA